MRILYHHRTQAEDAQGIHIQEMARAFRELGHDVEVVALVQTDATSGRKVRGESWRWIAGYAPAWLYELLALAYNLYGYRRLCQTIRRNRPQLIYERYSLNTFCGIWASRRFRIPIVLEVNAPLYLEQKNLGRLALTRLARFSERWICSHATYTIAVSKVMKDLLIQAGVPADKIVVMPNGIDPHRFNPGISGDSLRERYGLKGRLVLGFVGWFRPWHGVEMLLQIMHEHRLAEQGISLLLVGDGPSYPALRRYTKEHNLGAAVAFTGPVGRPEVPAHIAAMDIAVQPSATEYACPMKIFEYMAMRKCIVAPDQPNIREILRDGVSASLFQPNNTTSFSSKLLALLRDPVSRESLATRAYQQVFEQALLWRANAERTLALLAGTHVYDAGPRATGHATTAHTVSVTPTNPPEQIESR
jgi:glycosyltransferase involved in cell wall biosynthesis